MNRYIRVLYTPRESVYTIPYRCPKCDPNRTFVDIAELKSHFEREHIVRPGKATKRCNLFNESWKNEVGKPQNVNRRPESPLSVSLETENEFLVQRIGYLKDTETKNKRNRVESFEHFKRELNSLNDKLLKTREEKWSAEDSLCGTRDLLETVERSTETQRHEQLGTIETLRSELLSKEDLLSRALDDLRKTTDENDSLVREKHNLVDRVALSGENLGSLQVAISEHENALQAMLEDRDRVERNMARQLDTKEREIKDVVQYLQLSATQQESARGELEVYVTDLIDRLTISEAGADSALLANDSQAAIPETEEVFVEPSTILRRNRNQDEHGDKQPSQLKLSDPDDVLKRMIVDNNSVLQSLQLEGVNRENPNAQTEQQRYETCDVARSKSVNDVIDAVDRLELNQNYRVKPTTDKYFERVRTEKVIGRYSSEPSIYKQDIPLENNISDLTHNYDAVTHLHGEQRYRDINIRSTRDGTIYVRSKNTLEPDTRSHSHDIYSPEYTLHRHPERVVELMASKPVSSPWPQSESEHNKRFTPSKVPISERYTSNSNSSFEADESHSVTTSKPRVTKDMQKIRMDSVEFLLPATEPSFDRNAESSASRMHKIRMGSQDFLLPSDKDEVYNVSQPLETSMRRNIRMDSQEYLLSPPAKSGAPISSVKKSNSTSINKYDRATKHTAMKNIHLNRGSSFDDSMKSSVTKKIGPIDRHHRCYSSHTATSSESEISRNTPKSAKKIPRKALVKSSMLQPKQVTPGSGSSTVSGTEGNQLFPEYSTVSMDPGSDITSGGVYGLDFVMDENGIIWDDSLFHQIDKIAPSHPGRLGDDRQSKIPVKHQSSASSNMLWYTNRRVNSGSNAQSQKIIIDERSNNAFKCSNVSVTNTEALLNSENDGASKIYDYNDSDGHGEPSEFQSNIDKNNDATNNMGLENNVQYFNMNLYSDNTKDVKSYHNDLGIQEESDTSEKRNSVKEMVDRIEKGEMSDVTSGNENNQPDELKNGSHYQLSNANFESQDNTEYDPSVSRRDSYSGRRDSYSGRLDTHKSLDLKHSHFSLNNNTFPDIQPTSKDESLTSSDQDFTEHVLSDSRKMSPVNDLASNDLTYLSENGGPAIKNRYATEFKTSPTRRSYSSGNITEFDIPANALSNSNRFLPSDANNADMLNDNFGFFMNPISRAHDDEISSDSDNSKQQNNNDVGLSTEPEGSENNGNGPLVVYNSSVKSDSPTPFVQEQYSEISRDDLNKYPVNRLRSDDELFKTNPQPQPVTFDQDGDQFSNEVVSMWRYPYDTDASDKRHYSASVASLTDDWSELESLAPADTPANMSDALEVRRYSRDKSNRHRQALLLVFTFLDTKTICNAACVCKEWRRISRHQKLWTRVEFIDCRLSSKYLVSIAKRCTQMTSLVFRAVKARCKRDGESEEGYNEKIRGCLEVGLEVLLKVSQNTLHKLELYDCGPTITQRCLWIVSCYSRLLRELTYVSRQYPVEGKTLWALGTGCSDITKLILTPLSLSTETHYGRVCLSVISKVFPTLSHLAVGGSCADAEALSMLVQSCSRLTTLELHFVAVIDDIMASNMCERGLREIRHLVVSHSQVTTHAVLTFIDGCKRLQSFVIVLSLSDFTEPDTDEPNVPQFFSTVNALKRLSSNANVARILEIVSEDL